MSGLWLLKSIPETRAPASSYAGRYDLPSLSWVELGKQVDVARQSLNVRIMELEGDAITFFDAAAFEGIGLTEAACPALVVMTVMAVAMLTDKYFFDMRWRIFNVFTVLIYGIQEQTKDGAGFSHVDPGENLFAFYAQPGVDEHVLSPAVTAADITAETVSKLVHPVIEGKNECPVMAGNEVKAFFFEKMIHGGVPYLNLVVNYKTVWLNGRVS
jgi:hypothetical protein